ncbi:hypothetical protein GF369_00145 [Candidatus Peregrinibacteria bacterium]|nr:hypothetical protein [Candidatus Peregrinibacteria bacterium]
MKTIMNFFFRNRKSLFILISLVFWASVIILKQGGQSLLIHYAWPFFVGGTFVFLFEKKWFTQAIDIREVLLIITIAIFFLTFLTDLSPANGSLELMNVSGGLLLALTMHRVSWEKKDIQLFFGGIIGIVLILDIWGLLIYISGHPFDRLVGPLIKPHEAFAGFPNLLANLNILALIPTVYFHHKQKEKKYTALFCIICLILLTSSLLTYSRAAWLSALIGIGIVVATTFRFNKRSLRLVLAFVISLILVTGINALRSNSHNIQSLEEKITFQSEDQGSSVTERIASIQRGIDMALVAPLTGVGAGSFNYLSQQYEENFETLSSYPYSLPIKIMAEHGFVVFILLATLLICIFIPAFKSKKPYILLSATTVLTLLLHHCMDNNLDFFAASIPLFMLLGISWSPVSKRKTTLKGPWISIVIIVTVIAGMIFVFHEAWFGRYYIAGRNAAGAGNHQEAYVLYEKAGDLFFPRTAHLAQSHSAYAVYDKTDKTSWLTNARQSVEYYIATDNPIDAQGPEHLAMLFFEQKKYSECIANATEAMLLGGTNTLKRDYYKAICTLKKNNGTLPNNFIIQLDEKLNNYFDLLKVNAHMTVLTDNPKYALYISELLYSLSPIPYYEDLRQSFRETIHEEYKKFHTRYGIDAEIDFLGGGSHARIEPLTTWVDEIVDDVLLEIKGYFEKIDTEAFEQMCKVFA